MITTNITNFRKNIYKLTENTIKFNETLSINTKEGNAILISEEEYNGMIATLELMSNKVMKNKLIDGMNTSLNECISEDEVIW
ncbi:type II toxin-antitoxin system Phd/YefM family antitoxin [[Clostridium] colinum]|uniref:type II toxin-antitoxin system Phd/YefM family antitoxin n=1 Tax=[Clostridium] colinum TaxID=36835 RepID=UPI00202428E6|nr:type II toxin-antitoxin system Phd/YefM family antitoxin [[Clostridium] colinum]